MGECGGWLVVWEVGWGVWGASCLFTRIDAGLAACHAATISPHTNEPCLSDGRQIIIHIFSKRMKMVELVVIGLC